MRSITVDGSCPDLNACIAVTMSAGLRPISRGTVVSTDFDAEWQPEQDVAPGGASEGPAADAGVITASSKAATAKKRALFMSEPCHQAPQQRLSGFNSGMAAGSPP